MDIRVKTKTGKAVHVGYSQSGAMGTYCPAGRKTTVIEVSADAEVTCKNCLKGHSDLTLTLYSDHPAQETAPEPTVAEPIQTIRISADMETILNGAVDTSVSLQTAVSGGVSWKAGKLYVTHAGRAALLWFLDMRAEMAREALSEGERVYPARRALWHAAVKLNRQASYMLAA